jgi:hypothetical protein
VGIPAIKGGLPSNDFPPAPNQRTPERQQIEQRNKKTVTGMRNNRSNAVIARDIDYLLRYVRY